MSPPIPLNDLARVNAPLRHEMERAIARVLDSGRFLKGRETEAFEEEWADFCGQKHCVACSSGTDALSLAALALTISEASVQATTLAQTAIGLHRGGARVKIADIDDDGRIEAQADNAVPVLLYGRAPSGAEARQQLFDAAQAHGWRPPDQATACWSFYPSKTLGALGDAGAVTTNDAAAAGLMRELRSEDGRFRDGRQITARMDEVQAAVLRVKLRHLPSWIAARQQVAARYRTLLPPQLGPVASQPEDLQHLFVVRCERRDALMQFLGAHGVETRVHYPEPLHRLHGPWRAPARPLQASEAWCRQILTLPCFPGLTEAEIARVTDLTAAFFEKVSLPD